MKILFFNTNIGYGGASKMIVWLANQCVCQGYDVTLLTYRDCTCNQIISPSVKHVHKQLEDINGKGNFFRSIKWLREYIKKEQFQVAVAFLSPSQLRLTFACMGTNTITLFSHRGDPNAHFKGFKYSIINKLNDWAFTHADALVFQTYKAMEFYGDKIIAKSTVIPNPINPLERTEKREGNVTKRIVNVGRLQIWQKRQDLLIKAFCKICRKYPDYVLDFYGDGEDENTLKLMAKDNPQIRFMGKTCNVSLAIQNASMFVLSSDFEGIPNALLEAMSLGLPCISTDCSPGGAALLIRNKENGILTPRGDAAALAEAMEYIITHPVEAEKMGMQAMEVNTLYAENVIAEKWKTTLMNLAK